MAKKNRGTGVGVGSSSILVIFILLCLTTFATLSLMSANADLRLTEKSADATRDYYRADAEAMTILSQIDGVLQDQWSRETPDQDGDAAGYLKRCAARVELEVPGVRADQTGGVLRLQYEVPVGDTQSLSARLRVPSDGGGCEIEGWSVAYTAPWEPSSDGFGLWDGGEEMAPISFDGAPPF